MNKIIDIIGYGGHSKVILDLAKFNEYNFFNFHDENNIFQRVKVRSIINEFKKNKIQIDKFYETELGDFFKNVII